MHDRMSPESWPRPPLDRRASRSRLEHFHGNKEIRVGAVSEMSPRPGWTPVDWRGLAGTRNLDLATKRRPESPDYTSRKRLRLALPIHADEGSLLYVAEIELALVGGAQRLADAARHMNVGRTDDDGVGAGKPVSGPTQARFFRVIRSQASSPAARNWAGV
jgi:hypothetical protein